MNQCVLRNFVREIVLEQAASMWDAVGNKHALSIQKSENGLILYLYEPSKLMSVLCQPSVKDFATKLKGWERKSKGWNIKVFTASMPHDWIVGQIKLKLVNGVYAVSLSAARKSYGPFLYDIALSQGRPVMPDRGTVSDAAENVWKYYYERRDDVTKLPVADANYVNDYRDSPWLNMTYQLKNSVKSDILERSHERTVSAIKNVISVDDFNRVLSLAGKAQYFELAD